MNRIKIVLAALPLSLAACAPYRGPLERMSRNGEVLRSDSEAVVEEARVAGEIERTRLASERPAAAALPSCSATACDPDVQADQLLREGDAYTAANALDLALARYDQADILRPGHAETSLRIARVLDKQLRPVEAIMRYQLFIHQMELEKIHAHGEVAAGIAEAIARARERVVVLEKR